MKTATPRRSSRIPLADNPDYFAQLERVLDELRADVQKVPRLERELKNARARIVRLERATQQTEAP